MKKILSILLALCMLLCALPLPALADEADLPSNDELFAGYVERLFYGSLLEDAGISTYADEAHNAGSRLTGDDLKIYNALKPEIIKIAQGQRESTRIDVPGVAYYEGIDTNPAMNALLSDFPYELFWFDKVRGWSYGGSFHISLKVDRTYSKTGAVGTFETDANKIRSVQTSVDNAAAVVKNAAGLSDYEKLVQYKKYICDAVTYNYDAANSGWKVMGADPWQLIYVFDGNPNTNVVCEGYSKAFQYLCDMTDFTDKSIQCYSVSGYMNGGGHMWNIVTIGNTSYMVDVTNCDEGSIGSPDKLFLAGTPGSVSSGYTFSLWGQNVAYRYDSDTTGSFGAKTLTLSSTNYDPTAAPAPTPTATLSGKVIYQGEGKATVTLINANTNKALGPVQTVAGGAYTVTGIVPGKYHIRIEKPGYATVTKQDVQVDGDMLLPDIDITSGAGDIDGDNVVSIEDLTVLLRNFGNAGDSITSRGADINGDGVVTLEDLTTLLRNFGNEVPRGE